jgi:hypothetical protein
MATFIPVTYSATSADESAVKALGYRLQRQGHLTLTDFLQKEYPGFNLLRLLQEVERSFTHLTARPIERVLIFDTTGTLNIEYQNDATIEAETLVFKRKFYKEKGAIQIVHEYCLLPEIHQSKGYIKPVFKESLQQYINMNAEKILVHAGLSGGGYTWARYGFAALHQFEVEAILKTAKKKLSRSNFAAVETIYNTYYKKFPAGEAFPIDLWAAMDFMKDLLRGSDWHGVLHLKNSEQLRNFSDYVSR